ncbi:MAG: hypothetical protein ABIV63_12590 [Caldimonas sp.]
MRKHFATFLGLALVLAFVVLFFSGRRESKSLSVVAPRVGLTAEQLLAMVPRIASESGATLGTSRRLVYLLACSGVPTSANLEKNAKHAADISEQQRLTPREAATTVLSAMRTGNGANALEDC